MLGRGRRGGAGRARALKLHHGVSLACHHHTREELADLQKKTNYNKIEKSGNNDLYVGEQTTDRP